MECDDEYWIVNGQDVTFAQPVATPSKIAAFNCLIRLTRIHAEGYKAVVSSRTIFAFQIR